MGKGTFERAFDLARMDSCRTVEDIGAFRARPIAASPRILREPEYASSSRG